MAALKEEYTAIEASDKYRQQSTLHPCLRTHLRAPANVRTATRTQIDSAVHLIQFSKIETLEEILFARQLEASLRVDHAERLELIPLAADRDTDDVDEDDGQESDAVLDEVETDTDDGTDLEEAE